MSLSVQAPAPRSWGAQIKDKIRRRYEQIAETGFDGQIGSAGYSQSFLDGLPKPVLDSYCGCGNPLAGEDLSDARVVINLGCGAGMDSRLAATLLPSGGLVVGVDLAPAMLRHADGDAVAADMENLPLANGIADLVLANASLNLAVDKAAALGEAFRVLRAGGRLLARDLIRQGELPLELMEDPLAWNTSLGGVLEENELRDAIHAAGFVDVRISGHRPFAPVVSVKLDAKKPS